MYDTRIEQTRCRYLSAECYNEDDVLTAKLLCKHIDITDKKTVFSISKNSLFNETEYVPWKVRQIDSFEGLITIYYENGCRCEIQRYSGK